MKMQYYRDGGSEKHLRDITGILKVSRGAVDLNDIAERVRSAAAAAISDAHAAVCAIHSGSMQCSASSAIARSFSLLGSGDG